MLAKDQGFLINLGQGKLLSVAKVTKRDVDGIDTWGQCYKTFLVRNLQTFVIS